MFEAGTEAYRVRCSAAETFWRCGVPWKEEALEILDRLPRFVTPEEATRRAFYEVSGFRPWRIGLASTNSYRTPSGGQVRRWRFGVRRVHHTLADTERQLIATRVKAGSAVADQDASAFRGAHHVETLPDFTQGEVINLL
ncbi:MAG: hypothetical protein OXF56_22640 [Rhodobacteraceae bacterium]|nr:hypothetical protein [Paracoccaceae bacterium]